uniref:SFRICE_028459 n=1 Tax=Spodoptera frugiperda TaxID=7108 RepID=A0A2H1VH46_SPOFR
MRRNNPMTSPPWARREGMSDAYRLKTTPFLLLLFELLQAGARQSTEGPLKKPLSCILVHQNIPAQLYQCAEWSSPTSASSSEAHWQQLQKHPYLFSHL